MCAFACALIAVSVRALLAFLLSKFMRAPVHVHVNCSRYFSTLGLTPCYGCVSFAGVALVISNHQCKLMRACVRAVFVCVRVFLCVNVLCMT